MTTNQIAYQKAMAESALNRAKTEGQKLQNQMTELDNAKQMYMHYGVDMDPTLRKYGGHYGAAWLDSMSDLSADKMSKFWNSILPLSSAFKK